MDGNNSQQHLRQETVALSDEDLYLRSTSMSPSESEAIGISFSNPAVEMRRMGRDVGKGSQKRSVLSLLLVRVLGDLVLGWLGQCTASP
jgi:hypothetical protein